MFSGFLPVFITATAVLTAVCAVVWWKRVRGSQQDAAKNSLLEWAASFVLLSALFMTLTPTRTHIRYHFDASIEVGMIYSGGVESMINLLLFVPFVILLQIRFRRVSRLYILLAACSISAIIEGLQYALPIGRVAAVHDFILNTFGSLVGVIIGGLATSMTKSVQSRGDVKEG
nr:VanZ family protein [Paenibacillus soyae]